MTMETVEDDFYTEGRELTETERLLADALIKVQAQPEGDVFTPLTEDRSVRLRFDMASVRVVWGGLWPHQRGHQATVEIDGQRFRVIGCSCALPHCMCDSYIKKVDGNAV